MYKDDWVILTVVVMLLACCVLGLAAASATGQYNDCNSARVLFPDMESRLVNAGTLDQTCYIKVPISKESSGWIKYDTFTKDITYLP